MPDLTSVVAAVAIAAPGTGGAAAPPPPQTAPVAKTKILPSGAAVPPADAPPPVVAAVKAGNQIRKRPYIWGGGHGSFKSRGYDCSGAVSYVLRAMRAVRSPLTSGLLARWGKPGPGRWVTVFANNGHVYMTVAGARFDTSSYGSGGEGPEWRKTKRPAGGFVRRHVPGL